MPAETRDCVIRRIDGRFIFSDNMGRWTCTPQPEKAMRFTHGKAQNFLHNTIAESSRDCFEIIKFSALDETDIPVCLSDEAIARHDWAQIADCQQRLFRELLSCKGILSTQLSNVDKEICDIEHYIEFYSLNAAKGYNAYKMLRERLQQRRRIKDELAKTNTILCATPASFASGVVEQTLGRLDVKKYSPRIRAELFDQQADTQQEEIYVDFTYIQEVPQ